VVVVAVALVAILAAGALAIDVGSNDGAQRRLQQVAEAAALAAAGALPSTGDIGVAGTCTSTPTDPVGAAVCNSVATNLANTNLTGVSVTWTPDFAPPGKPADPNQIEVAVTAENPSILAGVLGISSTTITQRAAASNAATGGAQAALYANDATCGSTNGIYTNSGNGQPANNMHVTGAIESAGSLTLKLKGGGNYSIQGATYGGRGMCPADIQNLVFTDPNGLVDPNEPVDSTTAKTWPATWNWPLQCDFSGASFTIDSSSTPGIYCATGNIDVKNRTTGNFTLRADSFTLGQNVTLSPAPDAPGANEEPSLKLLLWQTGSGTFNDGNSAVFNGGIWIQNATAAVNGNMGITGFLEASDIELIGNGIQVTGTGPVLPGTGATVAVTE
jgi:hypothetical protein